MEKIERRTIPLKNGLKMHVAEVGEGPLVLFLHGFPDFWYSWRHQMLFLADHGYRALAPDMRGYGDTTGVPLHDPSNFTSLHLVGDVTLLLETIAIAPNNADKVFVVGHDWGAFVAWMLCLYRPDRIKALFNLGVSFHPIHPHINAVDVFRTLYGDDHYICRFQEPGDIESEFASIGVKEILNYILSFRSPGPYYFPKGKGCSYSTDRAPWLTEEDLQYYATKFEQTGFTGAVNYYRVFGLNRELNAAWVGAQVNVPTKFIVGDLDPSYHIPGEKEYIHGGGFQKVVPKLQDVVVLEGAAHFVHQERPDEINQHLYNFLKQF